MTGSAVLDLLLIVLLVAYAVFGFRRGFILSVGSFIGIVAGATAAFLRYRWSRAGSPQANSDYR